MESRRMVGFLVFAYFAAITATTTASTHKPTKLVMSPKMTSSTEKRWRCPRKCSCNSTTREVRCVYQKLDRVPFDIPKATKHLILKGNHIIYLPRRLRRLVNLETLDLSSNELDSIPDRYFTKMRELRKLDVSSNLLEYLPRSLRKLTKLKILLARNNKLGKLQIDSFQGLTQVKELDLSDNLLQTLELAMFSDLGNLEEIYLQENLLHCDCELKNLEMYFHQNNIKSGYIVCDSPSDITGKHLAKLYTKDLCPPKHSVLVSILLGEFFGLMAILFAIYMCRRRSAAELEMRRNFWPEKELSNPSKLPKNFSESSVFGNDVADSKSSGGIVVSGNQIISENVPLTCHLADDEKGSVVTLVPCIQTNAPDKIEYEREDTLVDVLDSYCDK